MALFGKRPKTFYSPLVGPEFGAWTMPDVRALRRDPEVVNFIMKWVKAQIAEAAQGAPVPPEISAVQEALLQAFAQSRPEQRPSLRPDVYLGCHIGYLVGVMENGGGVARPGYSEGHYWTALAMLLAQLPDGPFGEEVGYSGHVAYNVARTIPAALEPCVAKAAQWASRQPTGA
jgi:hypothetical protein